MEDAARNAELLELILDLVGMIARRLNGMSRDSFEADLDEIDLTSFRLAHIGEASRKLSEDVKGRHSEIPWTRIYAMRNLISHDYVAIDPLEIWSTATQKLDILAAVCRTELDRLNS